jgi:hypothetical protein
MADVVRIEGLADLRRDLRAMGAKAEGRGLTRALRTGAEEVAAVSPQRLNRRTGHSKLRAGYRAGASGNSAYVRNRHPGAGPTEFGGVIRPKGTPITLRAQTPVTRALASKEDSIVGRVADAIDRLAAEHGWR